MTDAATGSPLAHLYDWFTSYCGSFRNPDAELQRNFDLKERHTLNVCQAARLIAEGGSSKRLLLAEVAALCHDLGRFPQFREFRTFKDSESLNHAHLSAQILKQNDVLNFLDAAEQKSVLVAVRLHNVFLVPAGLPPETEDLLRLLRDADKLDIWRVFVEYFSAPEAERASAAGLGFPDAPGCSPEVLAALGREEMVQLSSLKSLNDFKLLQLSWVYDINFRSTLRLIEERGVLERLAGILPQDEAVLGVLAQVRSHMERRMKDASVFGSAA